MVWVVEGPGLFAIDGFGRCCEIWPQGELLIFFG